MRAALLLALAACAGCRDAPAPVGPPAPSAERLRADLDGQRFDFFEDADGARTWTIGADEIGAFRVVDTVRVNGGERLLARVAVTLAAPQRTIRGRLQLAYHQQADGGWALDGVTRDGPNFSAGDASAVLFDAGVVRGDSAQPDRFALDVVARYDDGDYSAPFDGQQRALRALFDSTFASDSLRSRAVRAFERRIAAGWVRPGETVRLLAPGRAPRAVRIDSVDAGVDGCQYLTAWGPRRDAQAGLGTSSTIMGGARAPGRPLSASEVRAVEAVARERLALRGVRAARLRDAGAVAADLDGDGTDEVVAAFAIGSVEAGTERGVLVAVRPRSGTAPLAFERQAAVSDGFSRLTLVGVVDVDGDGSAEVVAREEGTEVYRYLIVTFRSGRFVDAFRGGGGGC